MARFILLEMEIMTKCGSPDLIQVASISRFACSEKTSLQSLVFEMQPASVGRNSLSTVVNLLTGLAQLAVYSSSLPDSVTVKLSLPASSVTYIITCF